MTLVALITVVIGCANVANLMENSPWEDFSVRCHEPPLRASNV